MASAIRRELTFDLPLDDLWEAVCHPEGLGRWLGDDVDLDEVRPGAAGRVLDDDGTWRRVVITSVEPDPTGPVPTDSRSAEERRLAFVWWPEDDAEAVSRVELVVVPTGDRSRLRVTETLAMATSSLGARLADRLSIRCSLLRR